MLDFSDYFLFSLLILSLETGVNGVSKSKIQDDIHLHFHTNGDIQVSKNKSIKLYSVLEKDGNSMKEVLQDFEEEGEVSKISYYLRISKSNTHIFPWC